MLESSPSVTEVVERLRRFMPAIGLPECSVDATLSAVTLSYWRPGLSVPITVTRAVDVSTPRLSRLSGASDILDRVGRGSLDVASGLDELRALQTAPSAGRRYQLLMLVVSIVGWVIFLSGWSPVTMAVAVVATILTLPLRTLVARITLPNVFGLFLTAALLSLVPNVAASAGVPLEVGPAVVGALFINLPGLAVVSSVIDGISGAPISAVARGLGAVVSAGGLALGMLAGSALGAGLGLAYDPRTSGVPLLVSTAGAALGMAGLAVSWGIPRRALGPTLAMGCSGWLTAAITPGAGLSSWVPVLVAATVVGLAGAVVAGHQRSSTSVYLGVAILPLVPGFPLYRSMLALAQGDSARSVGYLSEVFLVSMSIAIGVAVGIALGKNLVAGERAALRRLPGRRYPG